MKCEASKEKKKKEDEDEDGKKKKRRKKDPNAPKRAMSSFMYFSQSEREVRKWKDIPRSNYYLPPKFQNFPCLG